MLKRSSRLPCPLVVVVAGAPAVPAREDANDDSPERGKLTGRDSLSLRLGWPSTLNNSRGPFLRQNCVYATLATSAAAAAATGVDGYCSPLTRTVTSTKAICSAVVFQECGRKKEGRRRRRV